MSGGSSNTRQECLRRANLYGVSSPKRLPHVHLEPKDVRVRRDLAAALLVASRVHKHHATSDTDDLHRDHEQLDDELNDRKHRENQGLRPPLDQIQSLQDLYTTVPKDLRMQHGRSSSTGSGTPKREWRVGYKNTPHGDSRGPLNGMFEPFDAVRESGVVIVTHDGRSKSPQRTQVPSESIAVAYPLAHASPAAIAAAMEPFDEEAAREAMERKTSVKGNQESSDDKTPWCPASFATIHEKGTTKRGTQGGANTAAAGIQPFSVRRVATGETSALPPRARKAPLSIDAACVQKKQNLLAKAAASYARIRARIDRNKDPKLRYALPVEDTSKHRAYRLGLDAVPSSIERITTTADGSNGEDVLSPARERLRFRPRSAPGTTVPFRSAPSVATTPSSRTLEPTPSVSKVAGAKRRPTSASVCYLGSATVYCVDAPSSQPVGSSSLHGDNNLETPTHAGSSFSSVLDRERRKRRCNQDQTLAMLAKRGLFHNLPIPQIFARLRRESLKNLTRRLQYAQYEKMSMDEYMRSCGMALVRSTADAPVTSLDASTSGETSEHKPVVPPTLAHLAAARHGTNNVAMTSQSTTSSLLLAMRGMLVVTRQQFHIALEAFNLAPTDVNLLFSALDASVDDCVALWEILCAVEKLQDGHAELRRARVQIKARDLPKDLELLRQSFRIPNVLHAPVDLTITTPGDTT